MAQTAHADFDAKQAIEAGFSCFEDFYGDKVKNNVLLEGLEYLAEDGQWRVVIGFQAGRVRETANSAGFGQVVKEPIREKRVFYLDGRDGSFVKMVEA